MGNCLDLLEILASRRDISAAWNRVHRAVQLTFPGQGNRRQNLSLAHPAFTPPFYALPVTQRRGSICIQSGSLTVTISNLQHVLKCAFYSPPLLRIQMADGFSSLVSRSSHWSLSAIQLGQLHKLVPLITSTFLFETENLADLLLFCLN